MEGLQLKVTRDITLKNVVMEDALDLFDLVDRSREYLGQWLPWVKNTVDIESELSFIRNSMQRMEFGIGLDMGIWFHEKLAGIIGFNNIDLNNMKGTIGYFIGQKYQGNGIMISSCRTLVNYGFHKIGLNKIVIRCASENIKSRRIPEKLGFTVEGILREEELLSSGYVNHYYYGMIRRDWDQAGTMVE
ncbi:MAG: GNAT family N-acetyltransferase [Candidatus Thermoplasmatota archaeon]|jgi:ribosomal-protein-serine acetyltransferase|nr:GNAT family N-acetyltransferase [Candidatus Thermoplasmatota archaeon]